MARYFLDSSVLVKRYHRESGTDRVDEYFASAENEFFVSRLAMVELESCIARLVRECVYTLTDRDEMVRRAEADVADGILNVVAVNHQRLTEASTLLRRCGHLLPLRTLDAIHLATAQSVHSEYPFTALMGADKRLVEFATNFCGLPVVVIA